MSDADAVEIDHQTRASHIVSLFRKLDSYPNNRPIATAWALVFNVSNPSSRFFECLATVANTLEQLGSDVAASSLRPTSKQTYQAAIDGIYQFVRLDRLNTYTVGNIAAHDADLTTVELLDDVLRASDFRKLTAETRQEWTEQLEELLRDADVCFDDLILRSFVKGQIANLVWAIHNYDVMGIDGVSRSFGAMAAELARSQGMTGAATPAARAWYQKGKTAVTAIGLSIVAASAVVEKADNLLTHGGHIYEQVSEGKQGDPSPERPAQEAGEQHERK